MTESLLDSRTVASVIGAWTKSALFFSQADEKDSIVWGCCAACGGFNLDCQKLVRSSKRLLATSYRLELSRMRKLAHASAIHRPETPARVDDNRSDSTRP